MGRRGLRGDHGSYAVMVQGTGRCWTGCVGYCLRGSAWWDWRANARLWRVAASMGRAAGRSDGPSGRSPRHRGLAAESCWEGWRGVCRPHARQPCRWMLASSCCARGQARGPDAGCAARCRGYPLLLPCCGRCRPLRGRSAVSSPAGHADWLGHCARSCRQPSRHDFTATRVSPAEPGSSTCQQSQMTLIGSCSTRNTCQPDGG